MLKRLLFAGAVGLPGFTSANMRRVKSLGKSKQMKFLKFSLAILLLNSIAACANAQITDLDELSLGAFRGSDFDSTHTAEAGQGGSGGELNDGGTIATGLEGLSFREPVRTEFYEIQDINRENPALYVELLYEINVRDASEKLFLEPGELVTIDYEVTLLDSDWAPMDEFCIWNWEDENEEPFVFRLPRDFVRPGDILEEWQVRSPPLLRGFTQVSDTVEFCDFRKRRFLGIASGQLDSTIDRLVLPCASYKGTLVVEYDGECIAGESSIRFSNGSAGNTVARSNVSLNWDQRRRFVSAFPFYEDSAFDTDGDALAIAPDKLFLLDGQTAEFENYTSYDKGLNGIIIDVESLSGISATANDFVFRTGTDNTPDDWDIAPTPTIITEFGEGAGGTDRIKLIWGSNAIKNSWLQVHMKNISMGCGVESQFYFGNVIAETGDDTDTRVDAGDISRIRSTFLDIVDIDSNTDINRSGRVDIFDFLLVRNNFSGFFPVPLITPQSNSGE